MPTTDTSRKKRWAVIAGVALAAVAIAIAVGRRSPEVDRQPPTSSDGMAPGARTDFPINSGAASANSGAASADAAAAVPSVEQQVENLMTAWRAGIVNKDADAVVAADAAFRHEPQKFRQALMTSAETDSDDRVRAFSTRVLGKLIDPACAPVFQRLLSDKSQYVRMNAAWGLGELAQNPQGRAAAKPALHALRRLEKTESFKDGREAASLAARRLM